MVKSEHTILKSPGGPVKSAGHLCQTPGVIKNKGRCRAPGLTGSQSGFSLVEVSLAIGIMAFAFVSIFGLLPIGLNVFRQAIDTSVSSQIIQRVLNDAQETDFDQLTLGATGATNETLLAKNTLDPAKGTVRWFDDQGNELPAATGAIYHVNTRIMPATTLPKAGTSTTDNKNLATVTVQVANNPGNRQLAFETGGSSDQDKPLRLLWSGAYQGSTAVTVPLVTFSAVVARNQ